MASSFIQAKVIKKNNHTFVTEDGVIGKVLAVPTPGSGGVLDGDYWAVPITDYGVWAQAFNFEPAIPTDETPPTIDSFHVVRIIEAGLMGDNIYYVRGRSTINNTGSPAEYGYIEASSDVECCVASPRTMPQSVPLISACQTLCNFDAAGKYFGVYSLPSLAGNFRYLPYGSVNNVAITGLTATGYTSGAALVTALNGNAQTGPLGTWTFAANTLKVTQTAGTGLDVICMTVGIVNPSA